tara:strand:- start:166 stop:486 length:321 start_codon:yes stop_codon:yes gene_type:complete
MNRVTFKEIKSWIKSLEENRYKKIYNSDARRVAWFVNNNLSEDYETMPTSIKKKWPKAAYKRERFLAKEFNRYIKKQARRLKETKIVENNIRRVVRALLKEELKNG